MKPSQRIRAYKRKNFYVKKDFQRDFIIKFCILTGAGSILTMGLVYWLAMNSTTVGIQDGRVAVHTTADYLLPLMAQTVLLEVVIVSLATIALTMIISFKIAGPLYKLKMMFHGLGQGDFSTQMTLRKDDQLKDLAQDYNQTINKLNSKIKALKGISSSVDEIKRELDSFKTS